MSPGPRRKFLETTAILRTTVQLCAQGRVTDLSFIAARAGVTGDVSVMGADLF